MTSCWISSGNSIELFSVIMHIVLRCISITVNSLIISIQKLLIHLLIVHIISFWWRVIAATSLHLSISFLCWINHLGKISFSPDFLSVVNLLRCLILRWLVCIIFRQFVKTTPSPYNLRLTKAFLILGLISIQWALQLSLIVISRHMLVIV